MFERDGRRSIRAIHMIGDKLNSVTQNRDENQTSEYILTQQTCNVTLTCAQRS